MNLLFLASWYPESPNSRNGLFIWRHAEAAAMSSTNRVALVAAVSSSELKKTAFVKQSINGVDHFIAHYPQGKWGWVQAWRYLWALHRAVRMREEEVGKSDLFVVNVLWRAGLLAWLYQLLLNRPYIIIEHWSGYLLEGQGFNGFYLKYFTRLIADRAERILTVSNYLAQGMQSYGLTNRYHVLPNVVDTELFKPASAYSVDKPPYLLHISNLAEEKNFGFVLELWQALRSRRPGIELKVAGAYTPEARHTFGHFEGLHWLGFQEGSALVTLYREASALCMPSHFETFSIVIAEALACDCPVMATDLPTFDFYKPAKNFYALPPHNLTAWLATFEQISESHSGKSDYNFIKNNFSKSKVSEKMLSIIEGVSL